MVSLFYSELTYIVIGAERTALRTPTKTRAVLERIRHCNNVIVGFNKINY